MPLGPPEDGLPSPQRGCAMFVIVLGMMMATLDTTIVNLALPGIARELRESPAFSIWVVNSYQIATLVLLLPLASLGELSGYRRIYLCGMALFVVSSLGAAFAGSMGALIGARTLQGIGAAGVLSLNAALVRLIYPAAQLGRGMAINSLVVALSSVAGPSAAAAILSVASWQWLFAINLPLGVLAWMLGYRALPRNLVRPAGPSHFGLVDVLLNMLMFTLVFLGADRLGVRPEGGASVALYKATNAWGLLLAGLAVGVVYLRRQFRLSQPLFPVDLMRIPVFALSMGASVGAFCAQTLAYVATPFLLLNYYGYTSLEAGLLFTAWPLAIVAVAPIVGRLIGRFPDGFLGGIGMGLLAAGLALLAALPTQPIHADIAWRMALCGLGFGLFQSPNNHTIVGSVPRHRSGAASGMLGTARQTGRSLGAVLVGVIFDVWDSQRGSGSQMALALAAVCAAIAGVCSSMRCNVTPASR